MTRFTVRMYVCLAAMLVLPAATARAQYQPQSVSDPATGESYRIEGAIGIWFPTADIIVASEGLGIAGDQIDFKNDLGIADQHFPEFQVTLRATRRNKFRFQYIPIKYDASSTLNKTIVFNGIAYRIGLPVNSELDWKAYRFTYEYDVYSVDRGFAGIVLDAKYTDVQVTLASPIDTEFAHARAPIPAIGGIGRVYVVPNISITGELTGIKIPGSQSYQGHYVDFDLYGTLNITNNVGVQAGYRSFDLGYVVKQDSGSLTLKGLWIGVVARY